ncbi:MAG: ribulose-phosphate 3-epimerase [Epsilonproteobacteria bacterium]|nr:ribulose-phosphate 3-epimerase [Campylobacterota bacterium]
MQVAPSILSADFGKLEQEIIKICESGADLIHIDVMDGHFVPNLTIGPLVIEAIKKVATKPLDIHLMVMNNSFFIDLFAPFAPKYISFHLENEYHPHRIIQKIRNYGISPAIVLNPHSLVEDLKYLLPELDMVLLMSVNPGFGGQKFIPQIVDKISELKELIEKYNPSCLIEIDGGVNSENISLLKEKGVDIAVAGSYIFKHPKGYKEAINLLKR